MLLAVFSAGPATAGCSRARPRTWPGAAAEGTGRVPVAQCVFGVLWAVVAAAAGDVVFPSGPTQWSWGLVAAIVYIAVGLDHRLPRLGRGGGR